MRQFVRSDEHVATLRESGNVEQLHRYLEELYQSEWTERARDLGEQYPAFWDAEAETFTGPVTTNAIEGGNWRFKHELRTPYAPCQKALARGSGRTSGFDVRLPERWSRDEFRPLRQ